MLSSQQGFRSSLSCFHCVGLQHFGEWPVLRTLCARSPGCGCFRLRLDFQVSVSVRGGGQGAGFLVPAFSTRTLPSGGVPARRVQAGGFCVGMLPLACSTPACPGLLVVVRFRAVYRCCVLGCCFPLKISLWCWLAAVRGAGASFGAEGSWQLQASGKSGCTSLFTGCWCCWGRARRAPRSVS